jgi:hypothetical protein
LAGSFLLVHTSSCSRPQRACRVGRYHAGRSRDFRICERALHRSGPVAQFHSDRAHRRAGRRSGLLHRSSDIVIRVKPDTPTFAAVDGSVNRDFMKLPTSRSTFSALGYRQRIGVEVSQHVCAQVLPGSDGNQGLAFKRDNSEASSNTHLHVPPFFGCLAVLFGCKLSLQVASLKGSYFSTKRLKLD